MNAIKKILMGLAVACAAVLPALADGVTVSSADGAITVTVAADTVTASTPVYLVWDETDKGGTFAAWSNKVKLGDVTSAGGSFPTTGAAHSIPDGAAIRVFVGATVEKFASITAPVGAYALLDYHTNAKTELSAEFTMDGTYKASGNNNIMGGIQNNGSTPRVNYSISFYSESKYDNDHFNVWTYLQANQPNPGTITPAGMDLRLAYLAVLNHRGTLWMKGADMTWTPQGGTATAGTTQAPVYTNTQKFGVWCRSQGTDTSPDSNPLIYDRGGIAFHEIKFSEDGELKRDYIPSKQNDVAGFYDLVTGEFAPKAGGSGNLTLGESLGMVMKAGATASAAATYSAGDTPEPPPTPPEPPTGDVTVTLTTNQREITVAIAENAESGPVDVTLVWDTADRGSAIENWAHAEVIGQVKGPSGSVVVDAATYGIESGMTIRAFFGQKEFALYETLTKAAESTSVVTTDYIPGKTRKTSGIDLLATWTGTFRYGDGVSALFFGITDSTDSSNPRRFGASCGSEDKSDNYYTIWTWPQTYNSGRWKFNNLTASNMTTAKLMKLRMDERGTWASVTLSNAWPADTDYDYTAPMSVFGITKVTAGGEVANTAFGTYDLTLHALTVYEKPDSAHVVAAHYVPAKSGDAYGLYNTVNGAFLPATSNDGITPGTATNSVTGVAFSSSGSTQVEFETTDFVAAVIDAAATAFDGTLAQVGLAVTYPASADVYAAAWDWDDGAGYAHDAPARYYTVGTYTNRVKLTATGFHDFYGTGVVTVAEGAAPTGAYVDYPHAGGPVKPVNGVCGVPDVGLLQTWDCFPLLKNAGIPYARLHDMQLVSFQRRGIFIDIPNIFRTFANDVEATSSYRFDFTDDLIAHLYRDNGVQPIFRLGVSREEFVAKGYPPLSARKPADALKWAKICEKIIRHYTEGWNKGYTFNIPYWEIWSSPDDHPNASSNMLWNASFDDYKTFYGTVATYLKGQFPNLKFGGYTMSDVAALSRGDTSELATYRRTCAESFLAAARDNDWPLDFFSYRLTGDIAGFSADIAAVDTLLDSYGFTREKTQRFCAEWLPAPTDEKIGSAQQLAEIAAGLTALQQGPCDFACLYSALNARGKYAPLFKLVSPETPRSTINCFKAYHELRKLGTAVQVRNLPAGVFATAASDGGTTMKLLIANVSGAAWTPTLGFAPWTVVSAVNVSNWQTAALPASLPNNSVWLLTLNLNN